jgi:hypothetical protein
VAVELALEQSESSADHVGIWGAMVCQWARQSGAEPRCLSPALAQAFLQTEQPTLTPDLPRSTSSLVTQPRPTRLRAPNSSRPAAVNRGIHATERLLR